MSLDNSPRTLSKRWVLALLPLFSICLLFVGVKSITSQSIDPHHSSWATAIPLPQSSGLSRHASVVHNGIIYVMGGISNLNAFNSTIYTATIQDNAKIDLWHSMTSTETEVAYPAIAVTNTNRIYITGGYNGNNALSTTYVGELTQSGYINWERAKVAQAFRARYIHASVISGNKIFVIGGWDQGRPFTNVDYAAISTAGNVLDGWHPVTATLNPPRYAHAAVEFEGRIYVIGGSVLDRGNLVATNTVESAVVIDNGLTPWARFTSTTLPRLDHLSAVVVKSMRKIYVIGGRIDRKTPTSKTFWADIKPDGTLSEWTEDTSLELPLPLYRHSAVYGDNGSIYVIGGQTTDDSNQSGVYYIPPLTFTKSADPPGPVHEGDIITYALSYANTSLITQTITISDPLPFGLTLVPNSAIPEPDVAEIHNVVWNLHDVSPGTLGQVYFQARVALLPSLHQQEVSIECPPEPTPTPQPDRILPWSVACGTTQFWANGVTRQPPEPIPHTILVQVPPDSNPSEMWLLMKGTNNSPPVVGDQPAHVLTTTTRTPGATVWTTTIPSALVAGGIVTITTQNPRELNAVFLFNADDPPFDEAALTAFNHASDTLTYTLEMPSVQTETMDIILPFMDVTYWTDDLHPQTQMTTVSVQFDDQSHAVTTNNPNLGNGLLMTHFPFTIGLLDAMTATKVLTVTVNTEDDIYTLGPRVCRPVYVVNTAWLCSQQAGCISASATNIPIEFAPPVKGVYLPLILKP